MRWGCISVLAHAAYTATYAAAYTAAYTDAQRCADEQLEKMIRISKGA